MNIQQIFKNNESWVKSKLGLDANYFNDLSKGQSPDILYIGCSDSRVTAEDLMGAGPGEVFVHRNIANIVAFTDSMAFESVVLTKSLRDSFFSGEGFVVRFTGPGKVIYQTRARPSTGLIRGLLQTLT